MPERPDLGPLQARLERARAAVLPVTLLCALASGLALTLAFRRMGWLASGRAPWWSPVSLAALAALLAWPLVVRAVLFACAAPVAHDAPAVRWLVWRLLERARDDDRRGARSWPAVSALLGDRASAPRFALPASVRGPVVRLVARELGRVQPGREPIEERVRLALLRGERLHRAGAALLLSLTLALGAAVGLTGCARSEATPRRTRTTPQRAAQSAPRPVDPAPPPADPRTNAGATLSRAQWLEALFPDGAPAAATRCAAGASEGPCLLALTWVGAPAVLAEAQGLYSRSGLALGLGERFTMDGGYRGMVPFVPQAPVAPYERHLAWVSQSWGEFERFFTMLQRDAPRSVQYRWHGVMVRFARSTRGHTPAAFARDWTLTYNLAGGINTDPDRVRATLFHELFHLNDQEHGDWSLAQLTAIHQGVLARCGSNTACLTPYAPNTLRVRGGTYYSFQPGNDVREYAAELAVRYFNEVSGRWTGAPFRCGPPENARAWRLLADEFFGGHTPGAACRVGA